MTPVDVGPGGPALHADGSAGRVDADVAHGRQIDHKAVVDQSRARDVVRTAADGQRQLVLRGEADSGRDILGVRASGDRDRALVDHPVPHPAGGLVLGVIGRYHRAGQLRGELGRVVDLNRHRALSVFVLSTSRQKASTRAFHSSGTSWKG